MEIISEKISLEELKDLGNDFFDDMIKAVVDIEQRIMAVGAQMHADEEFALLDKGSKQENLWGINIMYNVAKEERVEFDSMINVRPRQNRTRGVEDQEIRMKIIEIVNELIS